LIYFSRQSIDIIDYQGIKRNLAKFNAPINDVEGLYELSPNLLLISFDTQNLLLNYSMVKVETNEIFRFYSRLIHFSYIFDSSFLYLFVKKKSNLYF
jgi:hypothetical protein